MVDTTKVDLTENWVKIADGSCAIQVHTNPMSICVYVSDSEPSDTSPYICMALNEPVTVDFKTPVYARLPQAGNGEIIVIG